MQERRVSSQQRELRLSTAFGKLAGMLAADFDMVELLQTLVEECKELSGTQAGAVLLVDPHGDLRLVASTSAEVDLVEITQLTAGSGPCLECFHSGTAIGFEDTDGTDDKWPEFQSAMKKQGFRSLHSTPVRLRDNVLGAMALLGTKAGSLTESDAAVAQALADVAAIGVVQQRNPRELQTVATRLQQALDDRIVIEQAIGMLSQLHSITVDQAFRALQTYARENSSTIRTTAEKVTDRTIDLAGYETPGPLPTPE